jgi:FKBP-type peptidyl-prolyl cis-trans isomerase
MPSMRRNSIAATVVLTALSALGRGAEPPPAGAPPAPTAEPAAAAAAASAPVSAPADPVADDASSYAVGLNFGTQLRSGGIERAVKLEPLIQGLKDALDGRTSTTEEQDRARNLVRTGRQALSWHNRQAAREFLARNAAAQGVTTTASGLQYRVLAPGNSEAASPALRDHVTVNYRALLIDGTEFDSSDAHPQAAVFTVGSVLKGWNEALLLMKPGAKWRLFLSPELAYGDYPPPTIPPGAALVFDLELLKVEPPPPMDLPHRKDAPAGKPTAARRPSPPAPAP